MQKFKQGIFIAVAIVMVLLCIGLIAVKKSRGTETVREGTRTFTGTVEQLIFEAGACDIEIREGNVDGFVLSYRGLSSGSISDSLEDGVLKLKYRETSGWLSKLFRDGAETKVTLTIPKNTVLEQANLEFGAAEVRIDALSAKRLFISVGAGELNAESLTAGEKANLQVGAGAFYADNVNLVNAGLECGVGEMELSGVINGESTVDCGVGEISLTLNGNEEDYSGELNCGLGSIQMGSVIINGSGKQSYGTSSAMSRMDIKCGIGEVDVRFK